MTEKVCGKPMRFAFDANTHMRYDAGNGYFHVALSPLTKAQVATYRGYELEAIRARGLDLQREYKVYRPAEELSKPETINSVIGIPITLEHEFIDPEQKPAHQVGMTGDRAVWKDPYLMNSMHITSAEAQRRIEDGSMRQLSLGYTFDPLWKSGTTPGGEHYDLIMTNIRANHVALVEEGRAGGDVLVLDSNKNISNTNNGKNTMDENLKQALMALVQSVQDLLAQSGSNTPAIGAGDSGEGDPVSVAEKNGEGISQGSNVVDEDGNPIAPVEDDDTAIAPAENADVTPAEDGDDENAPVQDGDDENAPVQDSDDENAPVQDGDTPAEDEDDEVALDSDEAQEILAKYGLEGASDEVKMAFLQGFKACAEKAQAEKAQAVPASDSRSKRVARRPGKSVMDSKKSRVASSNKGFALGNKNKTKSAVSTVYIGRSIEDRMAAADSVKSTLGNVRAYSYLSAADIYRAALKKLGVYTPSIVLPLHVLRESYRMALNASRKNSATMIQDSAPAPVDRNASKFINSICKHVM